MKYNLKTRRLSLIHNSKNGGVITCSQVNIIKACSRLWRGIYRRRAVSDFVTDTSFMFSEVEIVVGLLFLQYRSIAKKWD